MALKPYNELRKIDVLPHCEMREAKDDKGRKIDVPYLNWAKCKDLLHENGAEVVYFEPLVNEDGSSLFMTKEVFTNSKGQSNRCYEVRVKIVIDDMEFIQNYPLLNGVLVVRDDTINQLRVSNAQARAFVKGVAIRTGLGFGLWVTNDETSKPAPLEEDLSMHSLKKCQERLYELITLKMQGGVSQEEMANAVGMELEEFRAIGTYYNKLHRVESIIKGL